MSALSLVADVAADYSATVTHSATSEVELAVSIHRADGRVVSYAIVAYQKGDDVFAREKTPFHLPAFCPERHINSDGSFCLYWQEHDAMGVADIAAAHRWWQTLREFLLLQERVAKLRHWPGDGWAHGSAAHHQNYAEMAASALGRPFAEALQEGRLLVNAGPKIPHPNGPTLRVYLDGVHIYTVWEKMGRITNKQQPCICARKKIGRRTKFRSCGDHALQAARLAISILKWNEAEAAFWKTFRKATCCGTCDDCPLRTNVDATAEPEHVELLT
ncbi:E2 domain-containing protein [Robbsia andropogonis]|uniref:E2 domain-containing protein n=1 Tax=Robbsia andropogonis TaxID=28092 RepID=UPI000467519D|nr:E2 domain-containing protein [Robbsia andropogonis]